jgi:hypothetical protein
MCKPISAWLKPDGEICHLWQTDEHEKIARVFKLRDDSFTREQRAIRIEYSWRDIATIDDLETWKLKVDEDTAPEWATLEVLDRAKAGMREIAERMMVRDNRGSVAGGAWIILDGGRIEELIDGRIVAAQNDANLEGAHLNGAHLEGAHLYGAHLRGAHLNGANLEGAHLEGAHLYGAHLVGAYLNGANLVGAHLNGAHLEGAYLYESDSIPAGWSRDDDGRLQKVTP